MSDTSPQSPPRTVVLAFWAVIVQVVLSVIAALLLLGAKSYLTTEINKSNADALKKHKKIPYTDVPHAVHQAQVNGVVTALLIGVVFVLLAVMFRQGKSWSRWVLIVVALYTQQPFHILNFGGSAPIALRLALVLTGIASIATIVLLFLPDSVRFFASNRAARGATGRPGGIFSNGATRRPAGAQPFSLKSLFAPRPAASVSGSAAKADLTKSATSRTKAKARAAAEPATPPAASTARPSGGAKSRGRAKGR